MYTNDPKPLIAAGKSVLILEDNLPALKNLQVESVDLIYLDPPFFSGRQYNVIWGDKGEKRSFEDRWSGGSEKTGMEIYLEWMEERIRAMYRVLKPTGSFYLHCDHHASHYLKILCDKVFGYPNFRNEIVWHYTGGGRGTNYFPRKHDTILFYSKTSEYTFLADEVRVPYDATSGYAKNGITAASGKKYMPNPNGKVIDDVWDMPIINPMSSERVGYPTQKPLALLERVIKASSNPGDIVLDPFCGGGTTLVASESLGRQYIGIDESAAAVNVTYSRLINKPTICATVHSWDALRNMDPNDFADLVIGIHGGVPNPKKTNDKGIDGWKGLEPIQVKRSEHVGRNVVDNFAAALRREGKTHGTIIAFSFAVGAIAEASRLKNKDGLEIETLTVETIGKGALKVNKLPVITVEKISRNGNEITLRATAVDPEGDRLVLWNLTVDHGNGSVPSQTIELTNARDLDPSIFETVFEGKHPVSYTISCLDENGGIGTVTGII